MSLDVNLAVERTDDDLDFALVALNGYVPWPDRKNTGLLIGVGPTLVFLLDFSPILEFLVPYLSVAVSGNAACQRLEVHRHFRVNTRRMFRNTQS